MSSYSTARLVMEGIVENLRIYRLHQQEKVLEARKVQRKEYERRTGEIRYYEEYDSRKKEGQPRRLRDAETQRRRYQRRYTAHEGDDGHRSRRRKHINQDRNGRSPHRRHQGRSQQPSYYNDTHPQVGSFMPLVENVVHSTLHAAEALLGPDGTPFGSLPKRGRDMGWIHYAKAVYRHVKTEQDAGHRGRGAVEEIVVKLLQKRRGVDGENDEGRNDRSGKISGGKSKLRKNEEKGRDEVDGSDEGDEATATERREGERKDGSERNGSQRRRRRTRAQNDELSRRSNSPMRGSTGNRSPAPVRNEHGPIERSTSSRTPSNKSSYRVQRSPISSDTSPAPSSPNTSSVAATRTEHAVSNHAARLTQATRIIQSPKQPKQTTHSRPPTPAIPVASPSPPPAAASAGNLSRGASRPGLRSVIQPEAVSEHHADAARDHKSCDEDANEVGPVCEMTRHSEDVKVLERAQNGEDGKQPREQECESHTGVPLVAPQPRARARVDFHEELTAKLLSLNKATREKGDGWS